MATGKNDLLRPSYIEDELSSWAEETVQAFRRVVQGVGDIFLLNEVQWTAQNGAGSP